jgi:hypothetical protein
VERLRCAYCRNPIKEHQPAVGSTTGSPGAYSFHADCWNDAQVEDREASIAQQRDYERRIEAEGLAGVLSPYVHIFPEQREAAPVGASLDPGLEPSPGPSTVTSPGPSTVTSPGTTASA